MHQGAIPEATCLSQRPLHDHPEGELKGLRSLRHPVECFSASPRIPCHCCFGFFHHAHFIIFRFSRVCLKRLPIKLHSSITAVFLVHLLQLGHIQTRRESSQPQSSLVSMFSTLTEFIWSQGRQFLDGILFWLIGCLLSPRFPNMARQHPLAYACVRSRPKNSSIEISLTRFAERQ